MIHVVKNVGTCVPVDLSRAIKMQNENSKVTEQPALEDDSTRAKETRGRYLKYAFWAVLGLVMISSWIGAFVTIMASQR